MKFSERWLKEWVPVSLSTEALCDQLTQAGLEVDGVAGVCGDFSGVVVAEVTAVEPHPNADALSLCRVDAGDGAPLSVVCAAPNVREGLKSALARVGAELPGMGRIRAAKLRGVASNGMLCSAQELGLGGDADGILELPSSFVCGQDLREAMELDDVSVDLDLTPNRGDALSLRGLAREVGLLNDVAVVPPPMRAVAVASQARFPVAIDNPAGCPRYLGRVVAGVDTGRPTPLWLRERLRRCGLRSIDPVVDVTNYVLLELGQPMHAFDLHRLEGGIVVRDGRPGERLTLLDGRDLAVDEDVLLIADGNGPVAVAGVMGGTRSGVSASTRDVFLECAFFSPMTVAATARRFGLHTDASHRYERGVDYALQAQAMERASGLLLDIVGGSAGPVVAAECEARLPQRREVALRKARLDRLVGEAIPSAEVERIFERLEMAPRSSGSGDALRWTVRVPSHRFDIEREEDLVEEVLRVYGYNAVASRVPASPVALGTPSEGRLAVARLADLLVDLGYSEAVTYSFVDARLADVLDPERTALRVVNPISNDHAAMRTNLLPGLVRALRTNLARQAHRVRLFETGQCFRQHAEGLAQLNLCAGILFGAREAESWAQDAAPVDFFDVKGDVERLLALGGREVEFARAEDAVLHPGQAATVAVAGAAVGRLGRLHPEVEAALHLPKGVYVFELEVDALGVGRRRRHAALSRHPSVRRDLALVVDEEVAAVRIEGVARQALGGMAAGFSLFDVYQGEGVAPGKKSVAIGLTLQHPSRTLNDAEVNGLVDAAVAKLRSELGARLR